MGKACTFTPFHLALELASLLSIEGPQRQHYGRQTTKICFEDHKSLEVENPQIKGKFSGLGRSTQPKPPGGQKALGTQS